MRILRAKAPEPGRDRQDRPAWAPERSGTCRAERRRGSRARRRGRAAPRQQYAVEASAVSARWASMARAIGSRTALCRVSRSAGSKPDRCRRASLISKCDRMSLTCSTGVPSQSSTSWRPSGGHGVDGPLRADGPPRLTRAVMSPASTSRAERPVDGTGLGMHRDPSRRQRGELHLCVSWQAARAAARAPATPPATIPVQTTALPVREATVSGPGGCGRSRRRPRPVRAGGDRAGVEGLAAVRADRHGHRDVGRRRCAWSRTGGPPGAAHRSPHCRMAVTTCHRSRPLPVSRYSERGGRS